MPLKMAPGLYASAMRKGRNRVEALKKRRIEKELSKQPGYSRSKAKKMVSEFNQ